MTVDRGGWTVDRRLVRVRRLVFLIVIVAILLPDTAHAIPAFARRYNTGCTTCHTVFPRLNARGYEFRRHGYRFPGTHAEVLSFERGNLDPAQVAAGRKVWEEYDCASCHRIGKEDGGDIGPNLAGAGERHDDAWLIGHFRTPTELMPGTIMPAFPFSDTDLAHILTYLKSVPTVEGLDGPNRFILFHDPREWFVVRGQLTGSYNKSGDAPTRGRTDYNSTGFMTGGVLNRHFSWFTRMELLGRLGRNVGRPRVFWTLVQGIYTVGTYQKHLQVRAGRITPFYEAGTMAADRSILLSAGIPFNAGINGLFISSYQEGAELAFGYQRSTFRLQLLRGFGIERLGLPSRTPVSRKNFRNMSLIFDQRFDEANSGLSAYYYLGTRPFSDGLVLRAHRLGGFGNFVFFDRARQRDKVTLLGGLLYGADRAIRNGSGTTKGVAGFVEADYRPMARWILIQRLDYLRRSSTSDASIAKGTTVGASWIPGHAVRVRSEYQVMWNQIPRRSAAATRSFALTLQYLY